MKRKLFAFAATAAALPAIAGAAIAASAPTARTDGVRNVTQTSAGLRGQVNPNGASTTYYFQWGLTTSYGVNGRPKAAGSGVKVITASETATKLAAGTTYHYRLVATNEFGTRFGSDHSFKTRGHAPPGVVTGSAVKLSTTSATLTGAVFPGSASTEWFFQWGKSTQYGQQTAPQRLAASSSATPVSSTLDGILAPGTIYHFRLVARHTGFAPSFGQDASFMTYPSPPPVPNVVASTRPFRDRHRPYVFTTTGAVIGPSSIPARYACNGNVTIRFFRGLRQVGFTLAGIQPNCSFSAQTVFNRIPGGRRRHPHRPVRLRVVIRSISNHYLATNRARIEHVKLG